MHKYYNVLLWLSEDFMKKLSILLIIFLTSFNLFGLEKFEEVLIQKAVYPEQKQAIKKYLTEKAKHLQEEAESLKATAEVTRGGKKAYQQKIKKETLQKAKNLEARAKQYEKAAEKIQVQ